MNSNCALASTHVVIAERTRRINNNIRSRHMSAKPEETAAGVTTRVVRCAVRAQ